MNNMVLISNDDGLTWRIISPEQFYHDICTPEQSRPFCWVFYKNKLHSWDYLQTDQRYNWLLAKDIKPRIVDKIKMLGVKTYHFQPVSFVALVPSKVIHRIKKSIVRHRVRIALKDYKAA